MPSSFSIFEKAATQVGHIAFEWARVERFLGEFVTHLMGIGFDNPTAHILDGNTDIRAKIQMARGLAFVHHDDAEWLSYVLKLLDFIDNDLRVRRNTVIHAQWLRPKKTGALTRRTRKTKILRPQSFQIALETEQMVPVKLPELEVLRRDLEGAWMALMPAVWFMLRDDPNLGIVPPSTISWRHYLRLTGVSELMKRARAAQRRRRTVRR